MNTITARASRDGDLWLIHVPEVERWTQAAKVGDIDSMARDLAAVMTGEAPESIEVVVEVELPPSVREHLAEVERAREAEAAARTRGAVELRKAVRELRASHISVRDVGKLLGISYQRAHQLDAPTVRDVDVDAADRLAG